jgi:hypothetical protein
MFNKLGRRGFLQSSMATGALLSMASEGAAHAEGTANPPLRPGRVRWHEDFAAACAAGRASGKPVLLFHMMGRLDQKFC